MDSQYLPLAEYSTKYKVSISTLRRKIKAEDIRYVFEDGRYFICDEPIGDLQRNHRPSPDKSESLMSTSPGQVVSEKIPVFGGSQKIAVKEEAKVEAPKEIKAKDSLRMHEESVLSAANRLLAELKKAYSHILQEKEEQLMHLKEEVADLKTLVRVLEAENERLKVKPR